MEMVLTADHSIRGIVHIKNDGELIIGAFVEIVDGKEEVIQLPPSFTMIGKWTLVRDELREVLKYPLDPRLKKFIIAANSHSFQKHSLEQQLMQETILCTNECLGRVTLQCHWLRLLHLEKLHLTDEAMTIISKGDWKCLEQLNILGNCVTWRGIRTLVQTNFESLSIFNADRNKLGNKAMKQLSRAQWPRLSMLYLRVLHITSDGVKYLRRMRLSIPHARLFNEQNPISCVIPVTKLDRISYYYLTDELQNLIRQMVQFIKQDSRQKTVHRLMVLFTRLMIRDLNGQVKGPNQNTSLGNFLMMMRKGGYKNIL